MSTECDTEEESQVTEFHRTETTESVKVDGRVDLNLLLYFVNCEENSSWREEINFLLFVRSMSLLRITMVKVSKHFVGHE